MLLYKNLFVENFIVCRKFSRLSRLFVENFLTCRKLYLFVENFLDQVNFFGAKVLWLWKMFLIVGNFLGCGTFPWLWETYYLGWRKELSLNTLKTNANVEAYQTHILNLEQSYSSLAFFVVNKVNFIFSGRLNRKY